MSGDDRGPTVIESSDAILGLDFDGVVRKYPLLFRLWFDFYSPNDVLVRARLTRIRRAITSILTGRFPMILDGKLIDDVNRNWHGRKVLISGRCTKRLQQKALHVVATSLEFDGFVFRTDCKEYEEKFKERVILSQGVTVFVEDRKFVRAYLQRKLGISVLAPRDVEAYLDLHTSTQIIERRVH
jgi:hypothetical protein